jgi:hypothetical protein
MDLERLNKALSTYEVAEHIYKVDNGKTLGEALAMLKAANAEKENDDEDSEDSTLRLALKHRGAPTGPNSPIADKRIKLGQNRSKVTLNGKTAVPQKFSQIVNSADREFKSLTAETELPGLTTAQRVNVVRAVKAKTLSQNVLREVKDRVLKAVSDRAAIEESQAIVNPRAQEILSRKLHEGAALTVAAASIKTHYKGPTSLDAPVKPAAQPVTDHDKPALRMKDDFDVKTYMPPEFRRKIEPTQDMSFNAIAQRTKAAQTSARPKPEFRDTANNDQGDVSVNQPSAKPPTIVPHLKNGKSMGAETYKNHPNQEPQFEVNLRSPKRPVQDSNPEGNPYTGARFKITHLEGTTL